MDDIERERMRIFQMWMNILPNETRIHPTPQEVPFNEVHIPEPPENMRNEILGMDSTTATVFYFTRPADGNNS